MGVPREVRLHGIREGNFSATEALSHACRVQDIHGLSGELVGRLKASGATAHQRQIKPVRKRLSYTYQSRNFPTQALPRVNSSLVFPTMPNFVKLPKVASFASFASNLLIRCVTQHEKLGAYHVTTGVL